MKRFVMAAVFLVLGVASPAVMGASDPKPTVDLTHSNRIFVGWVDMSPDQYHFLDYDTKKEWSDVIDGLNEYFAEELKSEYLPGKTLTMAKNRDDVNAGDNDLYVKFTDVSVDKEYRLHLAIHFIDPKTNTELESVPVDRYTGRVCGLVGCLQKSLRRVGEVLNVEITTPPGKKK